MKKIEFLIVGISLAITSIISALFGFAGTTLIGTFWGWFWISFLVQVLLFVAVNSFLLQKQSTTLRMTELEELELLSKFTITLSCGYCKQNNLVPIQLNQRNTFKCESCNQTNSVTMQFAAVPLTTPLESVQIPTQTAGSIEFKVSA